MIALASASGATLLAVLFAFPQPHQAGVRFGKCQAKTNVYSAFAPAAISRCRQIEPTAFRSAASGPSWPSSEKSSQKSKGLAHHLARGQPRRYVTLPSPALSRQIASEPARGASLATSGFVIKRPCRCAVLRYSLLRLVISVRRPATPRKSTPAAFSSEKAIDTFADSFAVLLTTYRKTAIGRPDSSASRGMIGVNASSATFTGRSRS